MRITIYHASQTCQMLVLRLLSNLYKCIPLFMCSGHILKELLPFRIQCAFRKILDAFLIQCLVSNAVYT